MAQPARWLWGLIPLALLWGAGNVFIGGAIQQDIEQRAVAAVAGVGGDVAGARPVAASVEGRDVTVSGEVLSTDGASRAMAALRSEFGVRRAIGGLTQVVAQHPYSWSAVLRDDAVALSGFVPDEAAAMANVAAVRLALPGRRVMDGQTLAFGAPKGFAEMTAAMLAALPNLSAGSIALDDTRICIEGKASTPDAYLALRDAMARLGESGFQPVACTLDPPVVSPYLWSIEKAPDGSLRIDGFSPSQQSRERARELVARHFPGPRTLDDRSKPALGEPSAFPVKIARAIADLARLRQGKAEISADSYRVAGEGPDSFEACQALRIQIAQEDGPESVAQATIACPPEPPPMPALPEIPALSVPAEPAPDRPAASAPPATAEQAATQAPPAAQPAPPKPSVPANLSLRRAANGALVLEGSVRDEAARRQWLERAQQAARGGTVVDSLQLEPDLEPGADDGVTIGLLFDLVDKLRQGSVGLAGKALTLTGEALGPAEWQALQTLLHGGDLPGGLALADGGTATVAPPYGLAIALDRSGVSLNGAVPDAATHQALRALVAASPFHDKLLDELVIRSGAPSGFADAARLALVNLLRLDMGSAELANGMITLRGLTCRDLIRREVETSAGQAAAAGFRVDATIGLRQTGCVVDPPSTCQSDLDALTGTTNVLFEQAAAQLPADEATGTALDSVATILKRCPDTRLTIEGHANTDGKRRGYDNRDLSERRALRVRDELVERGIAAERLAVQGFGDERPLVPYRDLQARITNRRVQFTVAR